MLSMLINKCLYKKYIRLTTVVLLVIGGMHNASFAADESFSDNSLQITKHFSYPDRIRYDGSCMTIDGRDVFIRSAEFHYFRTPRPLWRDRFEKIKEAGFNTVDTYVPWNWHEKNMPNGIDDYSNIDLTEAQAWLEMAQDEFGLYTIVRPGPFICAEWAGGGYPRWLAKFAPTAGDQFWLRSADDLHIAWSVHWYNAVCKLFASEQLIRKPVGSKGIIMVQIENEYNAHNCPDKVKLLHALFKAVKTAGVEVPVFTCLTSQCRGSQDTILSQIFDTDNYYVGLNAAPSCAQRMMSLRAEQSNAPGFVTELQGGWFSGTGGMLSEDHYSDSRHYKAISLMSILGGAAGLNTYMFVGGTHLGGWGARGLATTYNYKAAVGESGICSSKYLVAQGLNQFIYENEMQLVRSEGGPCKLEGSPENLFGGVRVGPAGTRFVFLTNTDSENSVSGIVTVQPGTIVKRSQPLYNIDQNGQKVLIETKEAGAESLTLEPFEVMYDLSPLGTKVLVIPPGKKTLDGVWYPKPQKVLNSNDDLPASIRIGSALKCNDPVDGQWQDLPEGKSLPELGVNDQRYVLYRSSFSLTSEDILKFNKLLINSFSRDIISGQINGKLAKRLYPSDSYASAATRNVNLSFARIGENDYDNRFEVSGLLHAGSNEVIFLYENIGFEHGYFPMEELTGLRRAGLSDNEESITRVLNWQVATNTGGVAAGWTKAAFDAGDWERINLNTTDKILRKGNHTQPKGQPDVLMTWYRLEFELPSVQKGNTIPWRLLLNASGNGFMWLNGHDIGRYWEVGPQREFYLPECWLKFGIGKKNYIVMGLRQTANGAKLQAAEIAPYRGAIE